MNTPIPVLSLGAGVQSSTILLMACRGLLPRPAAAIFADTGWEPPEVYDNLAFLTDEASRASIPVHRVSSGNIRRDLLDRFTRGLNCDNPPVHIRAPDGSCAILRRQCTYGYKIAPIERFIRSRILRLSPRTVAPVAAVELWFGISADELRRVRISPSHWKIHSYPLIGIPRQYLDRPYTRQDCLEWLAAHYPGRRVPRSACVGCPYRSDSEWHRILSDPSTRSDVIAVDSAIRRHPRLHGDIYLHKSCRPLDAVARDIVPDSDTPTAFSDECLGYCGT